MLHPRLQKPLLITGGQDGTARLVNMITQKVVATIRHSLIATETDDADTGVSVEW